MALRKARTHAERLHGRLVRTFDVRVRLIDGGIFRDQTTVFRGDVIGFTAAQVANAILEEFLPKVGEPLEVETRGPKGGRVLRYRTWAGVIGFTLGRRLARAGQLRLPA